MQNWVKQIVDYVLLTEFDAGDLEFAWRDEREVDAEKLAGIAPTYVTNGIKTINEARAEIGLDPVAGGDVAMVFTGSGPVPVAKAAEGDGGTAEQGKAARLGRAPPFAKHSPDQPRVPAVRTGGGQWTSEDGGAGAGLTLPVADSTAEGHGDQESQLLPPIFSRPPIIPRVPACREAALRPPRKCRRIIRNRLQKKRQSSKNLFPVSAAVKEPKMCRAGRAALARMSARAGGILPSGCLTKNTGRVNGKETGIVGASSTR